MGDDLELRARHWVAAWGCGADGAALRTGQALLVPVQRGGVPLMLKLLGPGSDEAGAAGFLAALDGRGTVRVVESADAVLLMERVSGPDLSGMALAGQDDAATGVLCDLALAMQGALRGKPVPLIPMDRRLRSLMQARSEGYGGLLDLGRRLAADLPGDAAGWVPLHGDLHHFNVLQSGRGWLAIDPKGVLGPPVYDLANSLLNPFPHAALVHDPVRMARQAGIVAGRFAVPVAEVLRWTCLQGCLALAWSLEDGEEAGYWAEGALVAGRLAGLI